MSYYTSPVPVGGPTPVAVGGWETDLALKVSKWYTAETRKVQRLETSLDEFVRDVEMVWPTDEPGYPPAFVDDMLYQLKKKVMDPFTNLLIAFAGSPGAGFLGGAGSSAWQSARAIWDGQLLPLWNEAIDEKRAGTDFMFLPQFRRLYMQELRNLATAYGYLKSAAADKPFALRLGPITDGWVSMTRSVMEAFVRVAETVESAGEIAYQPLARTAEIVSGLVKVTAIGLVGYVAYKIFAAREEKAKAKGSSG